MFWTPYFPLVRGDEFFITSHFTAVEVESVAARALKGRLLNKKAHAVLLSLFANDLKHVLIVQPVSTALLSEAAAVARQYSLRASDALHLGSPMRAKQRRLFFTYNMGIGFCVIVAPGDMDALRHIADSCGVKAMSSATPSAVEKRSPNTPISDGSVVGGYLKRRNSGGGFGIKAQ